MNKPPLGDSTSFYSVFSKERVIMTEKLAPLIAEILNKTHGTNFSVRFWKIITSPYISAIISSKELLEKEIINPKPPLDVFANTVNPSKQSRRYGLIRYYYKTVLSFFRGTKINDDINYRNNIAVGFHYKDDIKTKVDLFVETHYPFFLNKKTELKKRELLIDDLHGFSTEFVKNIINLMPKFYVEYFQLIYNKISLTDPKEKIFHVSIMESFFMRLFIAKYVEKGAKLYFYQHGSSYGEYDYFSAHHFESSVSDKFYSWGWKILPNDVPAKAFRLEKFRNNYQPIEKKIDLLMVFPAIDKKNIENIKNKSALFFRNIDRKKHQIIIARPRPGSRFNRRSVLNFLEKDINKIDRAYKPLSKLVSKSKLVIQLTYPSTNMLECLYVDHPVVAILENNTPSEIVKPYYKFFLEKGVFHLNMESLVKHLNKIEVEGWWSDVIQHPIYNAFKNEFLRKV